MASKRAKVIFLKAWGDKFQLSWFKDKKHFKIDVPPEKINIIHTQLLSQGYDASIEQLFAPVEIIYVHKEG